jgi:RNA polymerase sigma-70 factor (ECF subfamily)
MNHSERSLLKKIKDSDKDAFHLIFSKYQPVLFRNVYYQTGDYNLAQDIVQETFLKVWLNRDKLKPEQSFFSYIARISRNLIKDHYKHQQVRTKHQNSLPKPSESAYDNPEAAFNLSILEQQIHSIVKNHLPGKCRTVFILSRIEGKSNQEIADMLQISKKTVENQLYHAMKVLRKKLKKYL